VSDICVAVAVYRLSRRPRFTARDVCYTNVNIVTFESTQRSVNIACMKLAHLRNCFLYVGLRDWKSFATVGSYQRQAINVFLVSVQFNCVIFAKTLTSFQL